MTLRQRLQQQLTLLRTDIKITDEDLLAKHRRGDLHGTRDAIVDIEIFKAKIEAFQEVVNWLEGGTPL